MKHINSKVHNLIKAALICTCSLQACGKPAFAYETNASGMEMGGFDLTIDEELPQGWWTDMDTAEETEGSSGQETPQTDTSSQAAVQTGTDTTSKVAPQTDSSNQMTAQAGGGNPTAAQAGSSNQAPAQTGSSNQMTAQAGGGNPTAAQTDTTNQAPAQTGSSNPTATQVGRGNQTTTQIATPTKTPAQVATPTTSPTQAATPTQAPTPTRTPTKPVTPTAASDQSLLFFAKTDSKRRASENTLEIYHYESVIDDIQTRKFRMQLRMGDYVSPLSVRINGRECDWQEEPGGLLLEAQQSLKELQKSESVLLEAILLYEPGAHTSDARTSDAHTPETLGARTSKSTGISLKPVLE